MGTADRELADVLTEIARLEGPQACAECARHRRRWTYGAFAVMLALGVVTLTLAVAFASFPPVGQN